ncbi:peptidase A4 family-domain-containing protein [Rhodocollybia butyracea]|uniref:Peptidase A4 family-domain-containing protein n=1 Tax=Rhodocollybia butyracea TaxID=206335 RepID=A0A9P5Q356_9AGAR|nr:peptidase A4 family-domain-containing protein [Rhodocollybia butyracea]
MMFLTAFLIQGLFVTAALAFPSSRLGERMAARRARRSSSTHQSKPLNLVAAPEVTNTTQTTSSASVEFSENWAGAILISDTNQTYQSISGTFIVPSISAAPSIGVEQCVSIWVGIDGDTCDNAIMQTGLDLCIQGIETSIVGWSQFFPAAAVDFEGLSFSAGQSVTLVVNVIGDLGLEGSLAIENNSNGQSMFREVVAPFGPSLCQVNAEWIVEDFETCSGSDCSLVPFPDFGIVVFTSATAFTSSGGTSTPATAQILDMEQNGQILATTTVSGDTVTIVYAAGG